MMAATPAAAARWIESSNGKNASEASTAPRDPLARLLDGNFDRIDAAHLAGADAHQRPILGQHDRVRFHVPADGPGEPQVGQLRVRRLRGR